MDAVLLQLGAAPNWCLNTGELQPGVADLDLRVREGGGRGAAFYAL